MQRYTQALWGYRLNFPDNWIHRHIQGVDVFSPTDPFLDSNDRAFQLRHVLIQPEWNGMLQPVKPVWESHIARMAGMIGAKKISSVAWELSGAHGIEAEIVLPKSKQERLWVGMLPFERILLKFMVYHPLQDRPWFEPQATQILKSLRFLERVAGTALTPQGIPLPPGCWEIDPHEAITDVDDPHHWLAFEVNEPIGAVQAFYLREALAQKWAVEEFTPYPNSEALAMARFRIIRDEQVAGVGLLPSDRQEGSTGATRIAIKVSLQTL